MKYPYMQFFTADWVSDPALSMCSATTRGIWIDLLCAMHSNCEGELTGTPEMLSRIARCTVAEMHAAIDELADTKTASITERNGKVTIVSRRITRDVKARKNNAIRQARYRSADSSNAEVTPHSSESESEIKIPTESSSSPSGDEAHNRPAKFSDVDIQNANALKAAVDGIDPAYYASGRRPPKMEAWANTFRLIREADSRTQLQIDELLAGLPMDPFWSVNVRAPAALRGTLRDGRDRFTAILDSIRKTQNGRNGIRSNTNGHGRRNYAPTPESDAQRRAALGLPPAETARTP